MLLVRSKLSPFAATPFLFPAPIVGHIPPPLMPIPVHRYPFGMQVSISPPAQICTPRGSPFFGNNNSAYNGEIGSTGSRESYYTSSEDDLDFNTGVSSGIKYPPGDLARVLPNLLRKKCDSSENRKNHHKNGRKGDGFNNFRQTKATDRFSKLYEQISHYCTDEDLTKDGDFSCRGELQTEDKLV